MRRIDPHDGSLGSEDEILIAFDRSELATLANCVGEALDAVEEWEFDTRVGTRPERAEALQHQIIAVLDRIREGS